MCHFAEPFRGEVMGVAFNTASTAVPREQYLGRKSGVQHATISSIDV